MQRYGVAALLVMLLFTLSVAVDSIPIKSSTTFLVPGRLGCVSDIDDVVNDEDASTLPNISSLALLLLIPG